MTQAEGVVGTTRLQFGAGALVWGCVVAFPFVLVLLWSDNTPNKLFSLRRATVISSPVS